MRQASFNLIDSCSPRPGAASVEHARDQPQPSGYPATLWRVARQPHANRLLPSRHPKATLPPPYSYPKATPEPFESHGEEEQGVALRPQ